jgi:hypothetical protein
MAKTTSHKKNILKILLFYIDVIKNNNFNKNILLFCFSSQKLTSEKG